MHLELRAQGWELRVTAQGVSCEPLLGATLQARHPQQGEMKRRRRNLSLNRLDDTSVTGGQGLCLDPVELLVARWPVRTLSQTASHKQAFTHQCDSAGRRREKVGTRQARVR